MRNGFGAVPVCEVARSTMGSAPNEMEAIATVTTENPKSGNTMPNQKFAAAGRSAGLSLSTFQLQHLSLYETSSGTTRSDRSRSDDRSSAQIPFLVSQGIGTADRARVRSPGPPAVCAA